ncbi:fibropellin-1 [Lingula anatina]|uniref:Fibropellin-1 n=1 Tax=Lingula anatina TaxID=7574 RepID=A0A1S3K901_LINAN|nr:fibropellin-1 [Lingula anatina]|eukprot:XP_013418924.1 fibropellin-1 [Lingula anatina]
MMKITLMCIFFALVGLLHVTNSTISCVATVQHGGSLTESVIASLPDSTLTVCSNACFQNISCRSASYDHGTGACVQSTESTPEIAAGSTMLTFDGCAGFESMCASSPCQNGGTCIDGTSGSLHNYTCACATGFVGEHCEVQPVSVTCGVHWISACQGTYGNDPCTVSCPSGCINSGSIWGTGDYTGDSALCRSAIHDGRIPESGGVATAIGLGALQSYVGSTQNGITTSSYGSYGSSFRFI